MKTLRARAARSLVLFAMFAPLGMQAGAAAQSRFAGTYRPSPRRIDVQIVTWGEDCGARPKSAVVNETGDVVVSEEGAHLALKFPDRVLKTNGCWSPNMSVKLVSATSANGRYQANCKTPPGDAKRELGRYTVVAKDVDTLELTEESDYDWQLKKSHCVAKMRSSQTLTSTRVKAPEETAQAPACIPSDPARLRLKPTEAKIAPGERVCFTARATDAQNCPVALEPGAVELSLVRPSGAQGTLSGSCFRAAGNAAQAEGMFKIVASGFGVRSEASVVVSAPDLSDITARRGPSSNGALTSGARTEESALESSVRAVATGSHGMLWLGVAIAVLGGLLSLAAVLALRAARKQIAAAQADPAGGQDMQLSSSPLFEAKVAASAEASPPARLDQVPEGPQRICPRCRRGYLPGTERCESDGEALLDYDIFVKQSETTAGPQRCSECGEALAGDAAFCGRCGRKVRA